MQFDDFMIKVMIDEDAYGNRLTEEAARVWNVEHDREVDHLGRPDLDIEWIEGTREIERACVSFPEAPGAPSVGVTPLRTVYLYGGSGYAYDGVWGHGVYQGDLVVEGLTHDLSDPAARRALSGLDEAVCRFELDDGRVGYGMHETAILGAHVPSGFEAQDAATMSKLRG
jgi:hypothetical protein